MSRSKWKLAAVAFAAFVAAGAAVSAAHVPALRSGTYGPGVAALCDPTSVKLPTAVAGLLLLATAQLAWLVRWARARSLRDFRGGYRIWWWASLALAVGGATLVTEVHLAVASTTAWLAGRAFYGSEAVYRFLPGFAALVLLLPSLQRDMRGCRTSRTLVLTAAFLWLAGVGVTVDGAKVADLVAQTGLAIPVGVICPALMLAGCATAFAGMLFHARHVVYESVEPPELPERRKKVVEEGEEAEAEQAKAKRTSGRRAKAAEKKAEPKAAKAEAGKAESKAAADDAAVKAPKPHFVLKEQVLKEPPKAAPTKPEPVAMKPEPVKAEPPKPAPAPAKPAPVARQVAPEPDDESDDEDMAEMGGRKVRLDGAENPLHGLSKRDRRKLRKEMKDRERVGME